MIYFFSPVQCPYWLWACKRQEREVGYSFVSDAEVWDVMCYVSNRRYDVTVLCLNEGTNLLLNKLAMQQVRKRSYIGRIHEYVCWSEGIASHIRH